MTKDNDNDHLSVLLDYWIEHNREHKKEYKDWGQKIEYMGYTNITDELTEIINLTDEIQHHLIHARKMLNSDRDIIQTKELHNVDNYKHHHHEHITFHVIGAIHTPYANTTPTHAKDEDGEFYLEIYNPYYREITYLEQGFQILVIYILKNLEEHISTENDHSTNNNNILHQSLNSIGTIITTIKRKEHGKITISPIPIINDSQILHLKKWEI